MEAMQQYTLRLFDKYLSVLIEMVKYGLVSVSALAVDVGLLYAFVEYSGYHHLYAATVSFLCGLAVNYTLARIYVFKQRRLPLVQEFLCYASIGVIGLLLNDLIILLLVWLGAWYLYAKAVSVAVVFFFNFFGRRRLFAYQ